MIKIVHIARPIAGVGVYISLLTKYIDKEFENSIICNKKENTINLKDSYGNNIETHHIAITRKINFINDIKCIIKIIKILKKENPDIIHCHSAKAGILGRLAGLYLKKKVFYTPHAYSFLSSNKLFKRVIFLGVEKIFNFLPSRTIACSNSEYKRTINDLGFNKEKVFVWNNSIEENITLENSDIINKLPDKFICSIGRPSYQKNTKLLVKAIIEVREKIKNIHLVILGAGLYSPSLEEIKDLIKQNSLENNITIIPWLERSKTLAVLAKSEFCVSTSRYEGLPYALIEALALSKPCIVTNVDGNKDLIIDGINGFLVAPEKKQIANKIAFLLNNPKETDRMSLKSRQEFLNKYNITHNISNLEKIYLK